MLFQTGFGTPHMEVAAFFPGFSHKWTSADGQRCTLLFTDPGRNDSCDTVDGRFRLTTEELSVPGAPNPP